MREKVIEEAALEAGKGQISPEQLVQRLGSPISDETTDYLPLESFEKYRANRAKSESPHLNECKPPIRLIRISGNTVRIFGHFEDSLEFYFDGENQLCLYRRLNL